MIGDCPSDTATVGDPLHCSIILKVYDATIRVLKSAVQKAKLDQDEELGALKRLDEGARRLERLANGPSVEGLIAEERARSHEYAGRSVFGWEPSPGENKAQKTGGRPEWDSTN
jgi:hypothetical protein